MPARNQRRILAITSTFPRHFNDAVPTFVSDLYVHLSPHYKIYVLCPHDKQCKKVQRMAAITVIRFQYAPEAFEKISYGAGILGNLKKNPLYSLLIPAFLLAEIFYIAKLTARLRPDLIHAHWLIPQGFALLIAKTLFRINVVSLLTIHGSDMVVVNSSGFRSIARMTINTFDYVTTVSESLKKEALSICSSSTTKISTASMGIDSSFLIPNKANRDKKIRIIVVGRLIAQKNPAKAIEVLKECLRLNVDADLTYAGDGPFRKILNDTIKSSGLYDKVRLLGFIDHKKLPAILSGHHFSLLLSDKEGFGLGIVESMACGTIPIVNKNCAVSEIIQSGINGFIVENFVSTDIARLIKETAADEKKLTTLSENAVSTARNHTWARSAEQYHHIIENLLHR